MLRRPGVALVPLAAAVFVACGGDDEEVQRQGSETRTNQGTTPVEERTGPDESGQRRQRARTGAPRRSPSKESRPAERSQERRRGRRTPDKPDDSGRRKPDVDHPPDKPDDSGRRKPDADYPPDKPDD